MRFILVGTLNALITVLIVWLMMDKLGCNYIATNITASGANIGYFHPAPVSFAVRFPFF